MELKFIIEMEIPDEVLNQLKANSVGLTIDDLIKTRVESALVPRPCSAVLVYRADEGKKPIDLYQVCPLCRHPWARHFDQIANRQVGMSDGSVGIRAVLTDPVPTNCSECGAEGKSCVEALKYK